MEELRIGISGWTYEPWREVFYPKGLAQKRELEYASRRMNSIEINGTFYKLQSPESYRKWAGEVPDDFLFSIKGSKYITHKRRLKESRGPLANFFASGLLQLGNMLGPILWQFAPFFPYKQDRFEEFLDLLPKTTAAASELASENTIRNPKHIWTEAAANTPLKYAFEPRHPSFFCDEFITLLRKHNAALVFADSAGKWPYAEDLTADHIYIRLHGSKELYASGYTDEELDRWAKRIRTWRKGSEPRDAQKIAKDKFKPGVKREVYVYFDNDIKVHAPFDAIHLAQRLGIKNESPAE
jgi:uncharacterized protein YecE (DUF72 family)